MIELKKLNVVLNAPEEVKVLIRFPVDANLAVGALYVARVAMSEGEDGTAEAFRRCRIVDRTSERRSHITEYSYTVSTLIRVYVGVGSKIDSTFVTGALCGLRIFAKRFICRQHLRRGPANKEAFLLRQIT